MSWEFVRSLLVSSVALKQNGVAEKRRTVCSILGMACSIMMRLLICTFLMYS